MENLKKTVCLVEDEPMIQETYALKLRESGYNVITANNGAEGLEIITRENPDIALIDINMPVMDGMELMKRMAKDPALSKIPIIVLTNYDDDKLLRRAGKLQSRFYLIKAMFTPSKVVGIVDEVLQNG